MSGRGPRPRWQLDETAFHRLLEWFDQGTESHGERYMEIRDRLVSYFGRRRCPTPEDLADETLNRVARRLEEQLAIDDVSPAHYCYITARFVLLESLRLRAREADSLTDIRAGLQSPGPPDEGAAERERTLECLERCLAASSEAERDLIREYYRTDAGAAKLQRKRLAERLGLTPNSLAIRAWRLRHRLERCVRECRERRQTNGGFVSSI